MVLVLDTGVLIDLERCKPKTLAILRDLSKNGQMAKITFVNRFEILVGIKRKSRKNAESAMSLLADFDVLHTNNAVAEILAALQSKYERSGMMLPLADMIIASITIAYGGTLVTTDRGFKRIIELSTIVV